MHSVLHVVFFSDPQMPFSSNGYHPTNGRMDAVEENVEVSISRFVIQTKWHIRYMFTKFFYSYYQSPIRDGRFKRHCFLGLRQWTWQHGTRIESTKWF